MNFNELKQLSAEYGFELVSGFADNYVLIPQNKSLPWASFDSLSSLEKALKKYVEEEERKKLPQTNKKPTLYVEDNMYYSLQDEISNCLKSNNIDAIVFKANKGEHHCKIISSTNLDGMKFYNGKHKISISVCSDMFGNTFYVGGRIK